MSSNLAHIATIGREIEDLQARLAAANKSMEDARYKQVFLDEKYDSARKKSVEICAQQAKDSEEKAAAIEREIAHMHELPTDHITEQIRNVETINRKVRENLNHRDQLVVIEKARARWDELTAAIEVIDEEKRKQMAKARFPVEGLSFDSTGVLFNGVPFRQASSAEQLKVSMAMGLAMNPQLRVVLIRDGSLLDDDSMRMVAEMAAKHDSQVWVERVGKGEEVSVIIEDGEVEQ